MRPRYQKELDSRYETQKSGGKAPKNRAIAEATHGRLNIVDPEISSA